MRLFLQVLKWCLPLCLCVVLVVQGEESHPSVEQIVEKMISRSQEGQSQTNGLQHAWRRISVVEELGSDGEIEKRKTKEYTVIGRGEVQAATLVKIDGRNATEREAAKEQQKEGENQDRYTRRDGRRLGFELDEKLVHQFHYAWLSNQVIYGRTNHVLSFTPKAAKDSGKIAERFLGSLGGRIWVDTELHEIARIEANLIRKITIGGFLAEVTGMGFRIERQALPEGVWVNTRLEGHAAGRKLFDRFFSRMEILQEGFHVHRPASP